MHTYCTGSGNMFVTVSSLSDAKDWLDKGYPIYRYDDENESKIVIATPDEGFLYGIPLDLGVMSGSSGNPAQQIRADLDYLLMFHE